jgi:hypothetical protein
VEFEASLVYRLSFRTAIATQRNPVLKNQKKKKKKKKKSSEYTHFLSSASPRREELESKYKHPQGYPQNF